MFESFRKKEEPMLNQAQIDELEKRSARIAYVERIIEESPFLLEKRNEALKEAVVTGDFSKAEGYQKRLNEGYETLFKGYEEHWNGLGADTEDPNKILAENGRRQVEQG